MILTTEEWLLFAAFLLIYAVFLFYDLFKRSGEEKYGYYAYILAVIPANYLWYAVVKNGDYDFGYAGAMAVLVGLWLLLVIRDIFIKDKSKGIKDADDVALMLIIAVIINAVASAVVPEIPETDFLTYGATNYWKYFYIPQLDPTAPYAAAGGILVSYKILVTSIVGLVLVPILIDLKGTRANVVALIVLTGIFMLPLWFIVFLWAPDITGSLMAVSMFLGAVVFFILLLGITRGQKG